ncbi:MULTISPECIES: hypothetical protein [unclassified Streptomyces]|uniref:hypothetical protein n=1 Tax=unclassified Streptomyces TaxID=2593676 RepID=UPI003332F118
MVDGIGARRLQEIIEATRERIGSFTHVSDSPDGLLIHGTDASVLAWALPGSDGTLKALSIDREVHQPSRSRQWTRWGPLFAPATLSALAVWLLWEAATASSVTAWAQVCAAALIVWLTLEAFTAPATLPRWTAYLIRALSAATVLTSWRLVHLPQGQDTVTPVILLCVLGYLAWSTYRTRSHQWGTPLSAPLRWPFEDGAWCVFQGGGKATNHHASIPEQRGAVDLVGGRPPPALPVPARLPLLRAQGLRPLRRTSGLGRQPDRGADSGTHPVRAALPLILASAPAFRPDGEGRLKIGVTLTGVRGRSVQLSSRGVAAARCTA